MDEVIFIIENYNPKNDIDLSQYPWYKADAVYLISPNGEVRVVASAKYWWRTTGLPYFTVGADES